jgi:DNA-directed RNA polymerase specialized sigma24 family protein
LKPELKKDWVPTEAAFRQLLSWLDEGVDSGGERYLEMRRRLAAYFDRRNCLSADELADETLNRVARRLEEEGAISDKPPGQYCYIIAKFVFLEYVRRTGHRRVTFDERSDDGKFPAAGSADSDVGAWQKLLDHLEQCLQRLTTHDRDLILEYYRGEQRAKIERRQAMASRLALSVNALAIRACRIRDRLEICLKTHTVEA